MFNKIKEKREVKKEIRSIKKGLEMDKRFLKKVYKDVCKIKTRSDMSDYHEFIKSQN